MKVRLSADRTVDRGFWALELLPLITIEYLRAEFQGITITVGWLFWYVGMEVRR